MKFRKFPNSQIPPYTPNSRKPAIIYPQLPAPPEIRKAVKTYVDIAQTQHALAQKALEKQEKESAKPLTGDVRQKICHPGSHPCRQWHIQKHRSETAKVRSNCALISGGV